MMSKENHDEDIVNSFLLLLRRVARKNSRVSGYTVYTQFILIHFTLKAQKELHHKWYDLIKVTTYVPTMTLLLNEVLIIEIIIVT